MAQYRNDPRWIKGKYAGKDFNGVPFIPGTELFYYPATKKILTGEAAAQASRDFDAAKFDEAVYRGDYL